MTQTNLAIPRCAENEEWLRPSRFAKIVQRTSHTVRLWCIDGTLLEFGYAVHQDPMGQYFIKTPKHLIQT